MPMGNKGDGRVVTWRNERNGDVVTYPEDSLSGQRCDELDNWHRVGDGQAPVKASGAKRSRRAKPKPGGDAQFGTDTVDSGSGDPAGDQPAGGH